MKKYIVPIVILGFILIWVARVYNGIQDVDQNVKESWGNVQNAYQLRSDEAKNLAAIAKKAGINEKEILESVINARAKATSTTIDASNLTPENIQSFQQAQGGLSQALGKLMVVMERYPEIKSTDNYRDFQAQYSRIEKRINVARVRYNENVSIYNKKVLKVPTRFVASLFGYHEREPFKADEASQNAPDLEKALN